MNRSNFFLFVLIVVLGSCKKTTNPNNEFEHEAITTVMLVFKSQQFLTDTFIFDDPDGDGGNIPVRIDSIRIKHNIRYQVNTVLLNKTKNPFQNVTPIIIEQGNSHELFYLPIGLNLQIEKTDKDIAGFPLGLQTVWQTSQSNQKGNIRIKLMHKPLIKGANDSHTKGHSDIDFYMPITIE